MQNKCLLQIIYTDWEKEDLFIFFPGAKNEKTPNKVSKIFVRIVSFFGHAPQELR